MTLPKKIRRFLRRNPDYEAAFAPDADLLRQVRSGEVHAFIIHDCPHATWGVFVERQDIGRFLTEHPSAIAASFNGVTLEPMQEN